MAKLTLAMVKAELAKVSATIRKVEGEYQVRLNEWGWGDGGVYYTDDKDDAINTAIAMRGVQNSIDAEKPPFATVTVFYAMGIGRTQNVYSRAALVSLMDQCIEDNTPFHVGHEFGNVDGTHPKR